MASRDELEKLGVKMGACKLPSVSMAIKIQYYPQDFVRGDGIVCIYSLDEVMANKFVEFEEGTMCIALNLKSNNVGVALMSDGLIIKEGNFRMNYPDTSK
ncbi:hypothetical protein L6164_017171 [Bauhinia variegata]|uniref:Uncharacterized protein n=1 Tax=Bauhinia variegata TaxID=167791 RepID=A0ACB9N6X3_BAUVA|nr:hypothetical protein L6164_017171 [Bauhinia variegata]